MYFSATLVVLGRYSARGLRSVGGYIQWAKIAISRFVRENILQTVSNTAMVTDSNYGRISYRFRDIDAYSQNSLFPFPPLFYAPLGGWGGISG